MVDEFEHAFVSAAENGMARCVVLKTNKAEVIARVLSKVLQNSTF